MLEVITDDFDSSCSTRPKPAFAWDIAVYRIVWLFDWTYQHGMDYFFAVLVRDGPQGHANGHTDSRHHRRASNAGGRVAWS
jgi:hypothetical protein